MNNIFVQGSAFIVVILEHVFYIFRPSIISALVFVTLGKRFLGFKQWT